MNSHCPVHVDYFLQHQPGDYPFAKYFCQCLECLENVEQWSDTEGQPQANLPAPSSSIHSTVTLRTTTTEKHWPCHICPESSPRWQDRDRHQLTHIPYFIHCPLPHCAWRGNRPDLFKKHWQKEDHRDYHERYGHTPERSQIETYDPWEILNQIINDTISPNEGEAQAILLVQVKAYELQKMDVWTDPWGRPRKQASSM